MPEEYFTEQTYINPVYPFSFPDPYVLKFRGEYFAFSTGFASDGKVFGILHSRDLVHWVELSGAMEPLKGAPPFYWAPEVTYSAGKFYLYYSAGNETLMELRVAVSDRPDGGFVDSGRRLTIEEFAIDAHVFIDDDGARYLFYATDFLEHTHIGTGTVVDRLIDWFTLEGQPRPVTRALYDWQVYDPVRKEKGGVRWHTVEGPFVLKRKGVYYEMFSGGNWQNISYGVSFAITDDIARNEEWTQFCDGEKASPILRTIPGKVIGPGHNSVIRGPNNRELFCVYHRWVGDARVLAIDRMDFAGNRIFVQGPTDTPRLRPYEPQYNGFDRSIEKMGHWEINQTEAKSVREGRNELIFHSAGSQYLVEINVESADNADVECACGFYVADESGKLFEFQIFGNRVETWVYRKERLENEVYEFPIDTSSGPHHLRIEADGKHLQIRLDEAVPCVIKELARPPGKFILTTELPETVFSGFALTRGFEDLFDRPGTPSDHGWLPVRGSGGCQIENKELKIDGLQGGVTIAKGVAYDDYEYAVNIRLVEEKGENAAYGFELINELDTALRIEIGDRKVRAGKEVFDLSKRFAAENYHQFQLLKLGNIIHLQMEGLALGSIPVLEKCRVAIFCENAEVALDMVRLTDLTNFPTSKSFQTSS